MVYKILYTLFKDVLAWVSELPSENVIVSEFSSEGEVVLVSISPSERVICVGNAAKVEVPAPSISSIRFAESEIWSPSHMVTTWECLQTFRKEYRMHEHTNERAQALGLLHLAQRTRQFSWTHPKSFGITSYSELLSLFVTRYPASLLVTQKLLAFGCMVSKFDWIREGLCAPRIPCLMYSN